MNLLNRFLPRVEFDGLDDFLANFQVVTPENFNYAYDVADEMARLAPDQLAMSWSNTHGEARDYTFADLKDLSDRTANFLWSQGIRRGDVVMLILKRHAEFWYTLLALHKIGAIAVPATHLLTTKDIVYRNNAAGIKMIIVTGDGPVHEAVLEAQKDSPTVQALALVGREVPQGFLDFRKEIAAASPDWTRPTGKDATVNDDISLLYFTSGTTGMPKMVTHSMTYPLGHIVTARYWQNCQDGGLHWTISDTGWGKAVWGKIYGQWLCGSAVLVYDFDKFVPSEILDKMTQCKVTSFCAPPTMYRFMLPENLKSRDFSHLKYCAVAGEPLNPEVFNQWYAATGCKPMEGFGQTETTCTILNNIYMEPKVGSTGRPNPAYDVDIVDEDGVSCDPGQVGEIVVRTNRFVPCGLFHGYYQDPERTKSVWHDDMYHTGDTAWRDEDGHFWYVGRTDDIIKSSGYRIGPFEVESALMTHPAVLETAITGVPDPVRGQVVKATIILKKGYEPSEALKKELQNHVKHATAPYKYPRVIEFVDELPKTISGKIRRVELREKDSAKGTPAQ